MPAVLEDATAKYKYWSWIPLTGIVPAGFKIVVVSPPLSVEVEIVDESKVLISANVKVPPWSMSLVPLDDASAPGAILPEVFATRSIFLAYAAAKARPQSC